MGGSNGDGRIADAVDARRGAGRNREVSYLAPDVML